MHSSCPCNYLDEPCHPTCTCVYPYSSSGCSFCCTYGSEEQRKAAALRIATALRQSMSNLDLDKMERQLIEALEKETPESFDIWMEDVRRREQKSETNHHVKKEQVITPALGMLVFHEDICNGKEIFAVVGIHETEVELENFYSRDKPKLKGWLPIQGVFRLRKICEQHEGGKSCSLPNVHCAYPNCEPYINASQ